MIIKQPTSSYKITSVGTSGSDFILSVTLDDKKSLEIYKDKFNIIEVNKTSGIKKKKTYQFPVNRKLSILPSSNKDRIYSEFTDIVKHVLAGSDQDMIDELKSFNDIKLIIENFNLTYFRIGDIIEKGSIKLFYTPTGTTVGKYKGDYKFKILWSNDQCIIGKSVKFVELQITELTVLV